MFHFQVRGRGLCQGLAKDWGKYVEHVEVADDQRAMRQVNVYDDGRVLRYDRAHWCDDFARLTGVRFSRKPKWRVFFPGAEEISATAFEKVWRAALRSDLWEEQLRRSLVPSWGPFRV